VVRTEEDRDLWREMERGVEEIIRRGGIPKTGIPLRDDDWE
jgi:hypothetical protein